MKNKFLTILRKIYLRADYGIDKPNVLSSIHMKKTPIYGSGIGYKFNQVLRADLNFQHRTFKPKKSTEIVNKISSSGIILNTYVNLMDEDNYMIPFLTAGIGYGTNKVKDFNFSGDVEGETISIDTNGRTKRSFMWNVGAGASFRLAKYLSIEAAYKYVDAGRVSWCTAFSSSSEGLKSSSYKEKGKVHEVVGSLVINL